MKVLLKDSSGWWQVESSAEKTGFIPASYVQIISAPATTTKSTGVMLFDYDEDGEGEISAPAGANVKIIDATDDDAWIEIEYKGNKGRVPVAFVKIQDKASLASASKDEDRGSPWHFNDHNSSRWSYYMKGVNCVTVLQEIPEGAEGDNILLENEIAEMDQLLLAIDHASATAWTLETALYLDIPEWRTKFNATRKAHIANLSSTDPNAWRNLPGNMSIREHTMLSFSILADRMPWAKDHVESPVIAAFFPVDAAQCFRILTHGFQEDDEDEFAYFGKGFYLTTSAVTAAEIASDGQIILVCLVSPGVIYPVAEAPDASDSLTGLPIPAGYQSCLVNFPRTVKCGNATMTTPASHLDPVSDIICATSDQIYPKIMLKLK
jgi:hypothetical protein